MFEPTKLKAALAFEPRVVIAAMHTTMIRDSITAYSTAVGPSSFFRNDTKLLHRLSIGISKNGDYRGANLSGAIAPIFSSRLGGHQALRSSISCMQIEQSLLFSFR